MATNVSSKASLSYLLNSTNALSPEVRKPVRTRRFPCAHCGFNFFTNSDLQKHISSVHLQLRPYGCTLCDKRFGEKSNAKKHFRAVHSKVKQAKCDQCSASFAFNDGLTRHLKYVHGNKREFHCSSPNCRSSFKQAAHLKKHMQSIHKNTP